MQLRDQGGIPGHRDPGIAGGLLNRERQDGSCLPLRHICGRIDKTVFACVLEEQSDAPLGGRREALGVAQLRARRAQLRPAHTQFAALLQRILIHRAKEVGQRVADVLLLEVVFLPGKEVLGISDKPLALKDVGHGVAQRRDHGLAGRALRPRLEVIPDSQQRSELLGDRPYVGVLDHLLRRRSVRLAD